MKKITIIIITTIFILFGLNTLNKTYANTNNTWNKIGNYMYYDMPTADEVFNKPLRLDIVAPNGSYLEYLNDDLNKWEFVPSYEDGTFNKVSMLFIPLGIAYSQGGNTEAFYLYQFSKMNDYIKKDRIRYSINNAITDNDQLPKTSGNNLGKVQFTIEGKRLSISIFYDNKQYLLNKSFDSKQDMSIFVTKEAYFINKNKPQIFINNDLNNRTYLEDILLAPSNHKPAFVPHTIWDLNTDTIEIIDKYITHSYMKQNSKGVLINYVYIDEFVIDKIMNVTLSWTSRTEYKFPQTIIHGKHTEWENRIDFLETEEQLKYRNLTNDWFDTFSIFGSISSVYKSQKYYQMPRISEVNFNNLNSDYNITRSEVETYFKSQNYDFNNLNANPQYKLWAFALQEGINTIGAQTVAYNNKENPKDPLNFKIIEINYITNDKLYQAIGNDMDLIIDVDDPLLPTYPIDPDEKENSKLTIIIFIAITLIVVYIMIKNDAFKKPEKFIGVLVGIAILGFIIYLAWGFVSADKLLSIILRL